MTHDILLAGFGGQGILFAGKILAYSGLMDNKEVSWLPSYGPEMRGGTCNCSVCISDNEVASPLVNEPEILIAMNTPSLEKFVNSVKPGGTIVVDSTMVDATVERTDVNTYYIPATQLATDNDLPGGANIILLGKVFKETGIVSAETFKKAIEKVVPAKKAALAANNLKAVQIGMDYNA
ncbi:MAG: 2-oxoacid:acceptor oxidoreductase family protein [Oscillospiraceae bacterium]|nr:2-oxoacid:acceptor oxidoreductase family protein [Oscillospiraceae bacterium]MBR4096241.1 2-oxoacid:acceptor oxidoreductase family protein [Oscillospiraceae bacterium]